MEHTWRFQRKTVVRLEINTNKRITIQSEHKLAPLLGLSMPARKWTTKMVGRWLVEAVGRDVYLLETERTDRDDKIIIILEEAADIGFFFQGGDHPGRLTGVRRVDVDDSSIRVQQSDPPVPVPKKEKEKTEEPKPDPTTVHVNLSATEEAARLNTEKKKLEEALQRASTELNFEKERSRNLQSLLNQKAENFWKTLQQNAESSGTQINQRIGELVTEKEKLDKEQKALEKKLKDAEEGVDGGKKTNEKLKKKLDALNETLNKEREVLETDIAKVTKELASLNVRMGLDQSTVQMLRTDRAFTGEPIQSLLENAGKTLKQAEKRFAAICRFREQFNINVEYTIQHGSGSLTLSEETGRVEPEQAEQTEKADSSDRKGENAE